MLLRELLRESLKHTIFQDKNEKWYIKDGHGIRMKQYGEFETSVDAQLECDEINDENGYDIAGNANHKYSKKQMRNVD